MRRMFGARIDEETATAITIYLTKKYGLPENPLLGLVTERTRSLSKCELPCWTRRSLRVVVKATPRLPAMPSGFDVFHQKWTRPVFAV
jgi:hypothetical protein